MLGGVFILLRDVMRTYVFFSLLLLEIHCSYFVIANLVFMLIYILEDVITFFHLSLHVLFLLFFYAHASYYLYAIFYFCFTLRCCDEFCLKCLKIQVIKVFLAMKSLLAKFQEFMLGLDFIVFNKCV